MKGFHYALLFITIYAAVLLANLSSNYLTAYITAYQLQTLTSFIASPARQETTSNSKEHDPVNVKERAQSKQGRALYQACRDWRAQSKATPNAFTHTEAERQCSRYEQFLTTGR